MNIVSGKRATSKRQIRLQADPPVSDTAFFEGCITNIFSPWLIEEIPDGAWQTLQRELNIIIKNLIKQEG
jgi:hypothetical protein